MYAHIKRPSLRAAPCPSMRSSLEITQWVDAGNAHCSPTHIPAAKHDIHSQTKKDQELCGAFLVDLCKFLFLPQHYVRTIFVHICVSMYSVAALESWGPDSSEKPVTAPAERSSESWSDNLSISSLVALIFSSILSTALGKHMRWWPWLG